MRLWHWLITLACCLIASHAAAEVVLLRSGDYVNGRIVEERTHEIVVEEAGGERRRIPRTDIRRILYADASGEEDQRADEAAARERAARIAALREERARIDAQLAALSATESADGDDDRSFFEAVFSDDEGEGSDRDGDAQSRDPEEDGTGEDATSTWPYTWRSAVVPGWGQYNKGSTLKGAVFLGATVVSGLYFYQTHTAYLSAVDSYDSNANFGTLSILSGNQDLQLLSFIQEDSLYNERIGAGQNRFNASVFFLAIYLWNVFDAYWYPPRAGQSARSSAAVSDLAFSFSLRPDVWNSHGMSGVSLPDSMGSRFESRYSYFF